MASPQFTRLRGSSHEACALSQVLQVTEYAPWKTAFVFLLNVVATFSWNYTDLFIMLLSVSLAQRFKQLNHRLRALKGKARSHLRQYPTQITRNSFPVLSTCPVGWKMPRTFCGYTTVQC